MNVDYIDNRKKHRSHSSVASSVQIFQLPPPFSAARISSEIIVPFHMPRGKKCACFADCRSHGSAKICGASCPADTRPRLAQNGKKIYICGTCECQFCFCVSCESHRGYPCGKLRKNQGLCRSCTPSTCSCAGCEYCMNQPCTSPREPRHTTCLSCCLALRRENIEKWCQTKQSQHLALSLL